MDVKNIELANGLRVLYKQVPYTSTVHCGYIINSGSRDDAREDSGIAHFIEHMIFKGTVRRKTFHIVNYLESVGGDLNAYTTKEKTCFYASLISDYFDRATELLTDITFNSIFPEKEIVKEKQVIFEEIDMYRNAPDEAIFEDFDELIFPGHSLGAPILGTKDTIVRFTQDQLFRHIQDSFTQDNIIFSIVGNVTQAQVNQVIRKYLEPLVLPSGRKARILPAQFQQADQEVEITTNQAHEILGGWAYPVRQGHYVPFMLLNNLLGGPAMNSRLSLNIREKYGLTYNISSFYAPYLDSGIWGVYYACEGNNLERIRRMVFRELDTLRNNKLGVLRLNQAKKQLKGQLALGNENLLSQMLGMAKDILDFGNHLSFAEYLATIDAVTESQILEAANEIFARDSLSRITYKMEG